MKSFLIASLAIFALFALATPSFAQVKHKHKKHAHKVHVVRPARRVIIRPAVHRAHVKRGVVVGVVRDPAMVAAYRATHQAHLALKAALPVYEGHRDLALSLCSLADKDIKAGINWAPGAPVFDFSLRKPLKLHKHRNKVAVVYTPEQVQTSNAQLRSAITLLQTALQALGDATGSHGGYRMQAATSLNRALEEIESALMVRHQ